MVLSLKYKVIKLKNKFKNNYTYILSYKFTKTKIYKYIQTRKH